MPEPVSEPVEGFGFRSHLSPEGRGRRNQPHLESRSISRRMTDSAAVTEIVRRDWRYQHEYAIEDRRHVTDVLTGDLEAAMARTEFILSDLGRRGGAGVWLENESLLAIRHVLVALREAASAVAAQAEEIRDAESLMSEFVYAYSKCCTPEEDIEVADAFFAKMANHTGRTARATPLPARPA